jgi:hypothetical protein
VVAPEQGAVPPQDGVGGDDQVKLPQHRSGESVKQCGKERPVGWAKTGPAGLALQDGELVAQCQDFDVLSVLLIGSKRRNVTMPVRAR